MFTIGDLESVFWIQHFTQGAKPVGIRILVSHKKFHLHENILKVGNRSKHILTEVQ